MIDQSALTILVVSGTAIAGAAALAASLRTGRRNRVARDAGRSTNWQEAEVVNVIDGDNIVVDLSSRRRRIRLDSIDCPKLNQHWGENAKYGLISLIGGRAVRIEEHGRGKYGRRVATLYVRRDNGGHWINVNTRMVALGHAWVRRSFACHLPRERQEELNRVERQARSRRAGLWRDPNPVPPWKWRQ